MEIHMHMRMHSDNNNKNTLAKPLLEKPIDARTKAMPKSARGRAVEPNRLRKREMIQ
jgi:hypothetical protein